MRDYSQNGEQASILNYFTNHHPRHRYLVDVGAFGGQSSNTMALLNGGWSGLLIDANPLRVNTIVRDFHGLDIRVVCVGIVGESPGMGEIHMHMVDEHCSLKKDWQPQSRAEWSVTIATMTLQDVLDSCDVPCDFDFLSIDAEGMDESIMTSFLRDGAYRPKLIVTEDASYKDADSVFEKYGYTCILKVGGNLMFEQVADGGIESFSQDKEDLVVWEYFQSQSPRNRFLVDVGACQKEQSNTWSILNEGWSGILIDADPEKEDWLKRDFAGMDVEIVICGVGDKDCQMDFHENKNSGSSSFLPTWDVEHRTGNIRQLRVRPLKDILSEYLVPEDFDYLSIDAEGMDSLILENLFETSDYRPGIIVTECGLVPVHERNEFFEKFGYELFRRTHVSGNWYSNLIYCQTAHRRDS